MLNRLSENFLPEFFSPSAVPLFADALPLIAKIELPFLVEKFKDAIDVINMIFSGAEAESERNIALSKVSLIKIIWSKRAIYERIENLSDEKDKKKGKDMLHKAALFTIAIREDRAKMGYSYRNLKQSIDLFMKSLKEASDQLSISPSPASSSVVASPELSVLESPVSRNSSALFSSISSPVSPVSSVSSVSPASPIARASSPVSPYYYLPTDLLEEGEEMRLTRKKH